MRIAIVTGSLEAGRDGVGDYSRDLASEALRQGAECRLLAFADRHIGRAVVERDERLGDILRLPFDLSWDERLERASSFLSQAPSDRLSVQYVPYSYDRRGVPFAAVRAFRRVADGGGLHVMLHETWIDPNTSLRARLVSAMQRRALKQLCAHPRAVVHTSNGTYRRLLQAHGVNAGILPLFGSIPVTTGDASPWLRPLLDSAGCDALSGGRDRWWIFVMFGALHPIWPPQPLLTELQAAGAAAGRKIAVVSAGRIGAGEPLWKSIVGSHGSTMPMIRLGEQPAERISGLLQIADFGIATTPLPLIGKSATAAAMFDHGLPVIVNREDCCWEDAGPDTARQAALIVRAGPELGERLRAVRRLPAVSSLPAVAAQWLAALAPAAAR